MLGVTTEDLFSKDVNCKFLVSQKMLISKKGK